MTIQGAIRQLKNLKRHCQSMVNDDYPEWAADVEALEMAVNWGQERQMSKILVTPKTIGIKSFTVEGRLTSEIVDGERIYYIAGQSFPAEIVTVAEEERSAEK